MYGQSSTYTELPAVGQIVRRGETLYEINGQPVVALYGSVAPWRAFMAGMSPGRDVAELNANLNALGYGEGLDGRAIHGGDRAAIGAFQSAHGLSPTGELLLGSVVFEPGAGAGDERDADARRDRAARAGAHDHVDRPAGHDRARRRAAGRGQGRRPGHDHAARQPDDAGKVTYVGTVATIPRARAPGRRAANGSSTPTIEVDVTPADPAATGHLDQAPVDVSITTASVKDALVVPVNALLALAGGGYALEEIGADGVHHLVAVELGIFDDADGLVQVSGDAGLAAGQRVVVPGE